MDAATLKKRGWIMVGDGDGVWLDPRGERSAALLLPGALTVQRARDAAEERHVRAMLAAAVVAGGSRDRAEEQLAHWLRFRDGAQAEPIELFAVCAPDGDERALFAQEKTAREWIGIMALDLEGYTVKRIRVTIGDEVK